MYLPQGRPSLALQAALPMSLLALLTLVPPAMASVPLDHEPLVSADAPWPDDGRETVMTFVHISDPHVGRKSEAE